MTTLNPDEELLVSDALRSWYRDHTMPLGTQGRVLCCECHNEIHEHGEGCRVAVMERLIDRLKEENA